MREVRKHYASTLAPKDAVGMAELLLLREQAAIPATNDEVNRK